MSMSCELGVGAKKGYLKSPGNEGKTGHNRTVHEPKLLRYSTVMEKHSVCYDRLYISCSFFSFLV